MKRDDKMRNSLSVFALAMAVTLAGSAANAAEIKTAEDTAQFSTLAAVSSERMTQDQMADVRGAAHVRLLIELRAGKSPPTAAAFAATTAAGSIGMVGNDRPAILNGAPCGGVC